MNYVRQILSHARTRSEAPALIDGDRVISYGDLDALVRRTAAHLAALGIVAGDRVGMCLKDRWHHVVAFLAVGFAGAVVAQIDVRTRAQEKRRIADALALKVVVTEPDDDFPASHAVVPLDAAWHHAVDRAVAVQDGPDDWDAPFILSSSSGTTGVPKFSVATHLQYYFRNVILPELPARDTQTRYLSSMPLCFSAGRGVCLTRLTRGDCVILYSPLFGPAEYAEAAVKYAANAGLIAPTSARQLMQIAPPDEPLLKQFDWLICGGGPLFAAEKRAAARSLTPNLFEFYGATAIGTIAILRPRDIAAHAESVGRPNAIMDVQVVDESGKVLPPGSLGRLRCRGPGAGSAVAAADGQAMESDGLRDGWYYPGEIASFDEAGFLHLQGRESEVVIRGGAKIHPSEIESALLSHPGVAEAAVVGFKAADREETLVAFVVANAPLEPGDLTAHCRARLASYKIPREFRIVAALPRNTSGKIDKIALAKTLDAGPAT